MNEQQISEQLDEQQISEQFGIVLPDADNLETYRIAGDIYTLLATAEDTGGDFSLFHFHIPAGGEGPLV